MKETRWQVWSLRVLTFNIHRNKSQNCCTNNWNLKYNKIMYI